MLCPGSPLVRFLWFVGLRRGFVQQHSMVILVDVKPDHIAALHMTLEHIGHLVWTHRDIYFHKTETVHYAAWMVLLRLKDKEGNTPGPARIVLETNYDGELEAHMKDLMLNCREAFDQVYTHCTGYPDRENRTPESVLSYLTERYQRTSNNPTAY